MTLLYSSPVLLLEIEGVVLGGFNHVTLESIAILAKKVVCVGRSVIVLDNFLDSVGVLLIFA